MSKPRSAVADYAVYFLVRTFVCVLQALSFSAACACANGLAWLAYRIDKRHREVARDNLRHAFPHLTSPEQRESLVRAVYRHFCTLLMEIIHVPRRLHTSNWRRHVQFREPYRLVSTLLSDRPMLLVTGHFGNWELGGYVLGLLGFKSHAIARPLDNPHLDDFLRTFRERTGQKLLAKKGDFDQMTAILSSHGMLATLADQDAGQRGLFVDFFGRPASTHKAVALLALEHRVPLLVIGVRKIGTPIRYEIVLEDVILPEEYEGSRLDAVKAITQRFTSALERIVRSTPEQYFWVHRRWKHQPAKKKSKQAA
jgi:Kdo2-lipid IVA lauroyltransferase/acyltransferase